MGVHNHPTFLMEIHKPTKMAFVLQQDLGLIAANDNREAIYNLFVISDPDGCNNVFSAITNLPCCPYHYTNL